MTSDMDTGDGSRTIGAVERACRIIDILEERERVGVSALAEELDLTKGTAHSYLATLVQQGYAVREDGEYSLSLRYLSLGETVRERISVYDLVTEELDGLADRFDERAQFAVEENGKAVSVYRAAGSDAISTSFEVGQYEDLHCIALGKVILATLPDERVEAIVDQHGLAARTEDTITERDELLAELDRIRERGYAIDDEERVRGMRCIAVPLSNDAEVIGAISVSGPSRRMTDQRLEGEIIDGLLQAANVIEVDSQLSQSV